MKYFMLMSCKTCFKVISIRGMSQAPRHIMTYMSLGLEVHHLSTKLSNKMLNNLVSNFDTCSITHIFYFILSPLSKGTINFIFLTLTICLYSKTNIKQTLI